MDATEHTPAASPGSFLADKTLRWKIFLSFHLEELSIGGQVLKSFYSGTRASPGLCEKEHGERMLESPVGPEPGKLLFLRSELLK